MTDGRRGDGGKITADDLYAMTRGNPARPELLVPKGAASKPRPKVSPYLRFTDLNAAGAQEWECNPAKPAVEAGIRMSF